MNDFSFLKHKPGQFHIKATQVIEVISKSFYYDYIFMLDEDNAIFFMFRYKNDDEFYGIGYIGENVPLINKKNKDIFYIPAELIEEKYIEKTFKRVTLTWIKHFLKDFDDFLYKNDSQYKTKH